jgi:hypothetical protein
MDNSENDGLDKLYTQDTFVFHDEKKGESIELKIQQVSNVKHQNINNLHQINLSECFERFR